MMPIPITPYHLKLRLWRNMLGEPSSSPCMLVLIFRISNACPTRPTTKHAIATNPRVQFMIICGREYDMYLCFFCNRSSHMNRKDLPQLNDSCVNFIRNYSSNNLMKSIYVISIIAPSFVSITMTSSIAQDDECNV